MNGMFADKFYLSTQILILHIRIFWNNIKLLYGRLIMKVQKMLIGEDERK